MKYEPFKTDFDPQPQQEQEDPNLLFDLFAAPFRGLEGLGRGVYSLADFVSFDALPDLDEERLLGSSKTIAGGIVEGITQFVVPFGGIAKGLSLAGKAAGKAGKASKLLAKGKTGGNITDLNWKGYLAASTVTDAVAFDGQEARLSNLIQQFPQLQNPVTEFLAADPDDNQAIGRAKNVLEGLLLEAGVAGLAAPFVKALGAVKARKLAKSKGATLVEEEEAVAKALGDGSELQIAAYDPKTKNVNTSLTSEELSKFRQDNNLPELKLRKDKSHPTQITGTVATYKKVQPLLNEGTTLDYGAGKNISAKAGIKADTFEPFPEKGFNPTFKDDSSIPANSYDNVINNAVLNVVPADVRDNIVRNIGRVLKVDGKAFINVRGNSVLTAKHTLINKDNMEVIVDSTGAYQKGFTQAELVNYLKDTLGNGFTVERLPSGIGDVAAVITKTSDDSVAKYDIDGAIDARPDPVPYKTNLEAARGLEGSRGADELTKRLRLAHNVGKKKGEGPAVDEIETVETFINTIGKRMFDDVSISISKKIKAQGQFDFSNNLITLRKDIVDNGSMARVAVHELWHSLERYLPTKEIEKFKKQFESEKAAFIKKGGPDAELLTKNKFPVYNEANYRYKDIDEYFAETMTDEFFKKYEGDIDLAPQGTFKRVVQEVVILLKDMFADVRAVLGGDRTRKVFNDFLKQRNLRDKPRDMSFSGGFGRRFMEDFEVPQSALDDIAVVKTASGGQAIRQASAGKMTVKDAQGNKIQQNTIDGGLSTDELSQVLEAGTKKLTAQPQQVGSEAQERIMYEEIADATGLSTKGVDGIVAQAGKDKTTLARINGRMRALRSYMVGNGLDIVELAKAYKGLKEAGTDDDVIAAKIKSKFELQLHLQANVANLASGFGRGLQSLQQKVGKIGISAQEIANKKLRQDYLRKRGGVDVDKIVNDILLATDGQPSDIGTLIGLNKIVRGTEGGKWTNMVREYYINSLLSGPRTWSVNLLGNFLTATLLQFERYVGGWMSADQNTRKAVAWTFSQLFGVREAWQIAGKVAKLQENLLDIGHGSFKEQQDITGSITGKNLLGEQLAKEKDGLAQAIDKVGDVVRIPSRILMSTDELFKQVLYRQRAAAQLFLQAADRGITDPKQISEYIHDSIQSMVTASGRHFSEGSLIKDAQELAKGQDFKDHVARENFIADEVSKARARHMELAREKGLVDAEDDYGALQQFSEQWIEPNLDFARTGTFTNDLGPVSSKFNQFIQAVPLGWLVIPFVRTPTNILKFAFDRVMAAPRAVAEVGTSKFSSLEGLRTDFLDQLKSADPLVRAEARGKLATSAMLNGVLMTTMFMNKDWITGGGPLNTREKRLWEAAGNRPYSIKDPITGNWISYQRLDPFATILGVYADLAHVQNDSVHGYDKTEMERVVAAMAVTLARNVTNKSYLAGIHKVVEALSDPETKATDMLNSLAAGAVPNILYHGQSISGDQELKETRNLADSLLRKLPGGSDRVDPRRNILGEAYVAEQIETMPFNLLNPFNPISWSSKNGDPILTELANLHHGFSPPSHKLNSLVDLTEHTASNGHSAYDRWLELQSEVTVNGRTLRDTLEKLINSKSYRSLDPRSEIGLKSPRVTLINRVLGTYRRKALMEMLKEFPQVDHLYKQSQRAKAQYRSGTTDQETVLQLLQ